MEQILSQHEYLRYSRQLLLPEMGIQGQEKLKKSSVLIVGAGGLGSPVSLYLSGAGIGKIGIVDFDHIALANIHRQVIYRTKDIGKPKVEAAKERLTELNPDIEIKIFREAFNSHNALRIAKDYDVIVDGTDNFPTRYLINDVAFFLGISFVYGSVFKFEGQVSVFDGKKNPCYRCIFPEPPVPDSIQNCEDGGVLGVLPGVIGTIQATETIKALLGIGSSLAGKLLIYDALDMNFDSIKLRKNSSCRLCGENPIVTGLIDYEQFCGGPRTKDNSISSINQVDEISPDELAEKIKKKENYILVDIREPHEIEISSIKDAHSIPLGQLSNRISEIEGFDEIILFCRTGSRTKRGTKILKNLGIHNVKELSGGINAWAKKIDSSIIIY
ncbi:molybdopterin-synthase adenylyltransferase MoeB [Chloroflexota bacterium]